MTQPDPASRPLLIRRAQREDLPATAALHAALLPHGLFPHLGTGFLRRWHATYLGGDYGIAYVAVAPRDHGAEGAHRTTDGDVVGFLLGSTDQVAHVEAVIAAHRRELVIAGAGALLGRPALAVHFLRTRARSYLRRLLRRRPGAQPSRQPSAPAAALASGRVAAAPPVAVVIAVAVVPAARGEGIGASLLETFISDVRGAGTPAVELVTQADHSGASAFYTRLGWDAQEVHPDRDGGQVRRFRRELAADSSESSPHADRSERG